MLTKLVNLRNITPSFLLNSNSRKQAVSSPENSFPTCSAIKIVHAGGFVEYYYTAVPAIGIIEKYPAFCLARPDVFRRPWESVVWPEEMLLPGQKFYMVPRRTVRKLRHRIERLADDFAGEPNYRRKTEKFSGKSKSRRGKVDTFIRGNIDGRKSVDEFSGKPAGWQGMTKEFSGSNRSSCSSSSVDFSVRDTWDSAAPRGACPDRETDGKVGKAVRDVSAPYLPVSTVGREAAFTCGDTAGRPYRVPVRRKKKVRDMVTWRPTLTVISEGSPAVAPKKSVIST